LSAESERPPGGTPREETRIVIRPDGEVVIENLSALLAEVAEELDPDGEIACRVELTRPTPAPAEPHADGNEAPDGGSQGSPS
jgi:hypothetical protein